MKFSAPVVTLLLASSSAHAATKPESAARLRRMYNKKSGEGSKTGKGTKNGEIPPPLCEICDTDIYEEYVGSRMGKSKSPRASKGGKSSKGCDAGGRPVTCGKTIKGPVTLASDVRCEDGQEGLTLMGPHAVLDCAGYSIVGPAGGDDDNFALKLIGGAKAMNCKLVGFEDTVQMEDGDNVLLNTRVLGNDQSSDGVITRGSGCMTIAGVFVIGQDDQGIQVDSSGTVNIFDTHVTGINDEGFDLNGQDLPSASATTTTAPFAQTCIYMDGVSSNGNEEEGIDADFEGMLDIRNSEILGNDEKGVDIAASVFHLVLVDNLFSGNDGDGLQLQDNTATIPGVATNSILVQFYGTNEFIGNNDRGFDNNVDDARSRVEVFGDVVSFGNEEDGFALNEDQDNPLKFVLGRGASIESCLNDPESPSTSDHTDFAFGEGVTFKNYGGTVTCNTIDTSGSNIVPTGFTCHPGCLPVNKAKTCDASW